MKLYKKNLIWLFIIILLIVFGFLFLKYGKAATNIDPTNHWAWNDVMGWLDFYSPGTATVTNTEVQGYASSTVGWISLNCDSAPSGNICPSNGGPVNYGISNDGAGDLAGWAWNDNYGWISLCGNSASSSVWNGSAWVCPSNPSPTDQYQVYIDAQSNFHGWAWNDAVGWISFNYHDYGGSVAYWVNTLWQTSSSQGTLESSTFDTGVAGGAKFNSVIVSGDTWPLGAEVQFQIAISNSTSGPWTFTSPTAVNAGAPFTLLPYSLSAGRYFRYRLTLTSDSSRTASPKVTKVIVNWSP